MRRPKIRPAHLAAATGALAVTTAFTAWSTANASRTNTGAWDGPIAAGWLMLVLSGLWFMVLGCYALYRLVQRLTEPPRRRTAPGTGSRAASPSLAQWGRWDVEYANWRAVNQVAASDPLTLEQPVALDDTQVMFLIDAAERIGAEPDRFVAASGPETPPSQRSYALDGAPFGPASVALVAAPVPAWETWRWSVAA